MSKVYLHYDGERGPEHTFIWRQSGGLPFTGRDLGMALSAFISSYERKHGLSAYDTGRGLDASRLRLVADAPDPLGAAAVATPALVLDTAGNIALDPAVVHPGCDIRVEERGPEDDARSAKERTAAGGGRVTAAAAPAAPAAAAPVAEGVTAATKSGDPAKAKKLAIRAEKMMTRKNLRGARDTAKEAIDLDPSNGRARRCLAKVYHKAGLMEEAFAAAKECCSKASDGGSAADFFLAGKCLTELGRLEEARTALGRARTAGRGSLVDDADAALAYCRFKMGDAPGAGEMYMEVLGRTNEKHLPSLVGYGRLALLFNQADKGMPSLLKAVMIEQENKEARKILAGALAVPAGMTALREQVVPSPSTSSVYSFLGTIAKDHGEMDASVQLLEVAASADPTNASCALGLVHGHEIRGDNAKALAAAKTFLSGNPQGGVGARGLKNSAVLAVLEGVSACSSRSSFSSSSSSSSLPSGPAFEDLGKAVRWTTMVGGWSHSGRASAVSGGGNDDDDISFAWCEDLPSHGGNPSGASAHVSLEEAKGAAVTEEKGQERGGEEAEEEERRGRKVYKDWLQAGGGGKEMYSAKDLDSLALCFAVVKILYLEGKWSSLPQLLDLVEPARLRSLMPLHKTNIRNEQAYYCCIAQLLACWSRSHSIPNPSHEGKEAVQVVESKDKKATVYVCGDSHTLTPAWHQVAVGGKRRVLRPALVTGLKHWHLRPESNFYPKKNFESVMAKIPKGSSVVFVLGEIDCREGILVAVEKLRYDTAEEGVKHTIGIFIKVAETLAKERKLKIFVHPVIPVLNETRGMVKLYNRVFRRMVDKSKHLHWLDFFDQLLDGEDGGGLQPEFRLDGTHLAPGYVGLLEKALADSWVE